MNASVNQDTCIGCALCANVCPGVFRMEDEKAIVYRDSILQEDRECARKSAEECPVQAITLTA